MELRHLRYFIAVAEEENVTRAAARLHVSQPPLTRQIRDLEDELGFALFVRRGKSLRLTEAGRTFAEECRAVLARLNSGIAAARAVATGKRGELNVGYAPSPSIAVLPGALRRFERHYPGVRVNLYDRSTPHMLEGLRERRLHVALMMEPPKAALTGIHFEPLRTLPMVVATARTHPFARKRRVALADVLGEPIVALARGEYADYHALLARVLGAAVERLRVVEECDGGPSLIAAVEAGRGVGLVVAALGDSAGRRVRLIPITPALPPAVMGVAYRSEDLNALGEAFVRAVKNAPHGKPRA